MKPNLVNAQDEPIETKEHRTVNVRRLSFDTMAVLSVVGLVGTFFQVKNVAENAAAANIATISRVAALEAARIQALQIEVQNAQERVTKMDINEIRQDIKELRNELRGVRR